MFPATLLSECFHVYDQTALSVFHGSLCWSVVWIVMNRLAGEFLWTWECHFFFLLFLLPSLPLLSVIETPQRAQRRFRRVQCPARESVSNFRNSGFTNLLLIPRWKHVNFISSAKEGRHSRGQGGWTDSALDRLIKGKLETLINLWKKSFKISLKSSQLHASL